MITEVLGVVLAGGRSSRLGIDKAAAVFGETSLLDRAVGTLSEVFTEVIVAGVSTASVTVRTVPDGATGRGPLSGLDAAYGEAHGRAVFLLAVDMPFVDGGTIRTVVEPTVTGLAARIPVSDGRLQPLCATYGSQLGAVVTEHLTSGDRSMARFISRIDDVAYLEVDPLVMTNVNTAADLEAATRRWRRRDNAG